MSFRVAIVGASGYTAASLIELLIGHDDVTIAATAAHESAGKSWHEVLPSLSAAQLPPLTPIDQLQWQDYDCAFFCLPHGKSAPLIDQALPHCRVIDLGADFRLHDLNHYEQWYGKHHAPHLLPQAVYGLSEWHRPAIADATLVANPGCYATAIILALKPLAKRLKDTIVIDAKSGISGAGREAKRPLLYSERAASVQAYGVGHHRHMAEMEQELSDAVRASLMFAPHLVPMTRGIMATIYGTLKKGESVATIRQCLHDSYHAEPFVHLSDESVLPETAWTNGSNLCWLGCVQKNDTIVIVSVLDNLLKGASGQAVQNMNIMAGYDETAALPQTASFP